MAEGIAFKGPLRHFFLKAPQRSSQLGNNDQETSSRIRVKIPPDPSAMTVAWRRKTVLSFKSCDSAAARRRGLAGKP